MPRHVTCTCCSFRIAQNTTSCERKDLQQVFLLETDVFPLCVLSISNFSVHDFKVSGNAPNASTVKTLVSETSEVENLAHTNLFASAHKLISSNYFPLTPWKHLLPIAARTQNNMNASFLFRRSSCFSCKLLSYWEKVAGNNKRCSKWNNFTDQNVAVLHQQLMKASRALITVFRHSVDE